ncbi:putative Fungal specific transcription factor [Arthroderma uncinatum]|uniref:putative Fungal specific transcription factor n=1 Tax=Arthroderma uncinatum TaxID=74035 RepID=UPI00144AAF7B|nr:putative Fungal specific transcription factor [Arthroderma uncinatum]KAF3479687.1 putative Fungal specific transcription factor [Arthroderma uncinatum]
MDQRNAPMPNFPVPLTEGDDVLYALQKRQQNWGFPREADAPPTFPQHLEQPPRYSVALQPYSLSTVHPPIHAHLVAEPSTPPRRQSVAQLPSRRSSLAQGRRDSTKSTGSNYTLACLNCRSKKIKCLLEEGGCKKCKKLGIPCPGPEVDERKRPSSKRHIRELHQRIHDLELALKQSEALRKAQSQNFHTIRGIAQCSPPESPVSLLRQKVPDNIIARLCDGRYQLNYDSEGQLRYFGPTSSLHLTDTVASSIVRTWGEFSTSPKVDVCEIDPETQDYLLNLYWKFQHTELQILHKEAFLRDMATGQTKFYSKALLYCIMACAARISHRPEIRAMVLSPGLSPTEELPPLFAAASKLVDEELKRPHVTTVQSLLLLSVIYCAFSQDTKGWVLTGTACRLALDLGLHRDCSSLSDRMTPMDMEARNIAFWGCVVFDRLWSLYLGRQYCLRLDGEVTAPRPGAAVNGMTPSWEARLADAWSGLLEIVGFICESLNQNKCTMSRVNELGDRLKGWYDGLHVSLQYQRDSPPSVSVLHMQYCAAVILLYRPLANFGIEDSERSGYSSQFRLICVKHAIDATRYMEDYRVNYGNATTLSGISLHVISTVSTTLIADITERRNADVSQEFQCLIVCVRTLLELEQTYIVAQQVRKVLEVVIRVCNLENHQLQLASLLPEDFPIGASFDTTPSAGQTERSLDDDSQTERELDTNVLIQRFRGAPPEPPISAEPLQMPEPPYLGITYNPFPLLDGIQIHPHPSTMSGDIHVTYPCTQ